MTAEWHRPWVVLLGALMVCTLTARLGLWQLDRARQKTAIATAIRERGALPPLPQAALARSSEDAAAQHYRPVRLRGRWLGRHTVYLDNRQMDGLPGFYVLTPLELAPGDAVLVQRGWVPRHRLQREQLAPVDTPVGEVELLGRVVPPPSSLLELGGGAGQGPIRQNLALADFSREIGVPLRPLSVRQLDDGAARDELLQRRWPQPATDVGKHHGYAFQWFALCALVAGLYVWFQLLRPWRARRRAAR